MTYDTDFYGWTQQQAEYLRTGQLDKLDLVNLLDEVETLGRTEKRQLRQLLGKLLRRWVYHLDNRARRLRVVYLQLQIKHLLHDSGSMRPFIGELMNEAWADLRQQTDKAVPETCPFTFDFIMQTVEVE
ncbi:DUF29 domain-containing protein [Salmonella enterica]|nr:DUF29 domain-containing protein [Salmonella enterica]